MANRILWADDEIDQLKPHIIFLEKKGFEITPVTNGGDAVTLINDKVFDIVFLDEQMPGMDGLAFLERAHQAHKDLVSIILTGNADQETAIRAINEGHVFRFLTKPCPPDTLELALRTAFRQHELITNERVLLRDTLSGSVRLLVEALTLSDPHLGSVSASIRRTIGAVSRELGTEGEWRYSIAGSLCLLGVIVQADARGDGWLSDEHLESCARTASRLVRNIPRLGDVADMIGRQREFGPLPETIDTADTERRTMIGARFLRFAVDLERLLLSGRPSTSAIERVLAGSGHDRRLIALVDRLLGQEPASPASGAEANEADADSSRLKARQLRPGMILLADVHTSDGKLLLSGGCELTPVLIERLRSLVKSGVLEDAVRAAEPGQSDEGEGERQSDGKGRGDATSGAPARDAA